MDRVVANATGQPRPASGGQERRTTPPVEAPVRPVAPRVHPVHCVLCGGSGAALAAGDSGASSAGCGRAAADFARQDGDLLPASPAPRPTARWRGAEAHRPRPCRRLQAACADDGLSSWPGRLSSCCACHSLVWLPGFAFSGTTVMGRQNVDHIKIIVLFGAGISRPEIIES